MKIRKRGRRRAVVLPKITGADIELGNFIVGGEHGERTGRAASRALVQEIAGYPVREPASEFADEDPVVSNVWGIGAGRSAYNPQDVARRYLSGGGGCAYVDLDHLEICLPEVRSARAHVAALHGMLRVARRALDAANARRPEGERIHVIANNSDGFGSSYGGHLNVMVTRRCWENLFSRKLHLLLALATHQVSSLIYTGQGKVGSENGAPGVAFQISQRADFMEQLVSPETTFRRPIVNSRDEPLAGPAAAWAGWRPDASSSSAPARLHVIFYDTTLCHVATFLRVGVLQIVLAMLEAERCRPAMALEDPVDAVRRFSHDPTLRARARTTGRGSRSALELQLEILEDARRFAQSSDWLEAVVPESAAILDLWEDTLAKLEAHDRDALAARLDWVQKRNFLESAMDRHGGLDWSSPEIKHLDLLYGSLDPYEGLYWAAERAGAVERLVDEAEIVERSTEPPTDTRAWTRAMLLRRGGSRVTHVNWDEVRFRSLSGWGEDRIVRLAHPAGFGAERMAEIFETAPTLDALLDALGATTARPTSTTTPMRVCDARRMD